jgi:hypothetical protein
MAQVTASEKRMSSVRQPNEIKDQL